MPTDCRFCAVVAGTSPADVVLDESDTVAFLDLRPVFPGHTLLVPRRHVATLEDLPDDLLAPVLKAARRVAAAVRLAMDAQGTFVAINNTVSQSVPHLHVHVVPRSRGDGLRGFFWPRTGYRDDDHRASIATRIRAALDA
jgi:histidine triad (HIT) family protein